MRETEQTLARFSRAERLVHRSLGLLMGTCLVTAFVLYYGPVSLAVGHRHAVELVHVVAGYALPVPLMIGLASSAYRADLGRLVTATYPLRRANDAIAHAASAGSRGAVKIAFDLRAEKERTRL